MASRNRSKTKGFTLIEILVVIGLLAIVGGFTAVISLDNYQMSAFRDERKNVITALQKARAEALNNINQEPHGVKVLSGSYVVFEGDDYATRDTDEDVVIPSAYAIELAPGTTDEVVFAQLTAEPLCGGEVCDGTNGIELLDPNRGMSITVFLNREGLIDWQ